MQGEQGKSSSRRRCGKRTELKKWKSQGGEDSSKNMCGETCGFSEMHAESSLRAIRVYRAVRGLREDILVMAH